MGRSVYRVALSGYYGFHNSGDEAVLQSILLALEAEGSSRGIRIEPVVLSGDPAWTTRTYGVQAAHRMKPADLLRTIAGCDGLISGGGSLLQDATSSKTIPYYIAVIKLAQWLGKPTFIYSQGIGPVNNRKFDSWIRGAFRKCRYVSVRDSESADLLRRIGYTGETEVVPDPVMGLPLRVGGAAAASGTRPVVGVSVRYWNADRSELEGLARSLNDIRNKSGAEIRFLPFHLPSDEEASLDVIRRMGAVEGEDVTVVRDVTHPQDMLAQVGSCDLLIGMRLHSLIYAASQYVPMVAISYDPKIDQFLKRLAMAPLASTEAFDSERLARGASDLLSGRREWAEQKRPLIEQLKAEAQRPARAIVDGLTRSS